MTYAPATLTALGAWYVGQGGVNAGIVGSWTTHCGGYHLGRDRIFSDCACKPGGSCQPGRRATDYSVQTTRDQAGLSDGAAAIDLGPIDGSYVRLRLLTARLLAACQAGDPDTVDVRELIGSVDGQVMFRWDDVSGKTAPYTADPSHLQHTHVSYYRDSEARSKLELIERCMEGEMAIYLATDIAGTWKVAAGKIAHGLKPTAAGWAPTGDQLSTGSGTLDQHLVRQSGSGPTSLIRITSGALSGQYVSTAEVDEVYAPAPGPGPAPSVLAPGVYEVK